ncbi:cyclase family protein, partial [Streptomyces sp. NPDC012617]|uniref:cyclase family protein n=1 Tax=Streptomyces sp. NPDC012617 TaxID=3156677 RepID=UPI0033CED3CB
MGCAAGNDRASGLPALRSCAGRPPQCVTSRNPRGLLPPETPHHLLYRMREFRRNSQTHSGGMGWKARRAFLKAVGFIIFTTRRVVRRSSGGGRAYLTLTAHTGTHVDAPAHYGPAEGS